MLTVTKAAGGHLAKLLDQVQAPADSAVRIVVQPEGLKTAIDTERSGDARFDHEGRKVLLLDPDAATHLTERTLDVAPEGEHLTIS